MAASPTTRTREPPPKPLNSSSDDYYDYDSDDFCEEDENEEISKETQETSIAAKVSIEQFYKSLFRSLKEREDR